MIEKQEGLAYLNGTLGSTAIFCDYQASELGDRAPKYRHPSSPDATPLHPPEVTNGLDFPTCTIWQFVDPRPREVIHDICLVVELLERSNYSPTTMGDYQFFGDKRNVIANGLVVMHIEFNGLATINECICLGLILFLSMTIGGIDAIHGVFDRHIPKFKVVVGYVHLKMTVL
jgi:hypothetical protein